MLSLSLSVNVWVNLEAGRGLGGAKTERRPDSVSAGAPEKQALQSLVFGDGVGVLAQEVERRSLFGRKFGNRFGFR
jgi:hypothetical protein